jgi:hypothetical protein
MRSTGEAFVLNLPGRQAEALRALAALEELPPEVYAAEVLAKHLYHAYTPEVARRAAALAERSQDPDAAGLA